MSVTTEPHDGRGVGPVLLDIGSGIAATLALVVLWRKGVLRLGGFSSRGVRDVRPLPVVLWLCLGYGLFCAVPMGAVAVNLVIGALGIDDDLPSKSLVIGIASAFGVACGVLSVWLTHRFQTMLRPPSPPTSSTSPPPIGEVPGTRPAWLRVGWRDVGTGVLCLVLFAPIYWSLLRLSMWIGGMIREAPPPSVAHETLRTITEQPSSPWIWLIIASVVVGAPIVEELVYRVFLQGALLRATGQVWVSIIVASVVFGLVHLPVAEPEAVVMLFVFGLALGLAYEWTGRLGVPICMHAMFNAANVVVGILTV